jgi:hypothetical protein
VFEAHQLESAVEELKARLRHAEQRLRSWSRLLDRASPAGRSGGKGPRNPSPALGTTDPFSSQALVERIEAELSPLLEELGHGVTMLAQSASAARRTAQLRYWGDFQELAAAEGLHALVLEDESVAHLESLVELEVDFDKRRAKLNGKAVGIHLPSLWSACLDEVETLRKAARSPAKFVQLLAKGIKVANAHKDQASEEAVLVREVFQELLMLVQTSKALTSGRLEPYPFQLFLFELSQLVAEKAPPKTKDGRTVELLPATLSRDTVPVFFRRSQEYRRVGTLRLVTA